MVKTTKKLLNFLQSLNKYVQKKTEKEYLFIRRYILFWENENRKGAVKPRPLCTPLGLFFKEFLVVVTGGCWLVVVFCGVGDVGGCADVDFCTLRYWNAGGWADLGDGDGEALCCRLGMGRFFIFCLQRWGNYMYSWVLGRRVNVGFSGMIVNEKFYYLSNEN